MEKVEQARDWMKDLEERKAAVAAERDKLRAFIDDAEALEEDCNEAYDNIDRAIDALSRLV